MSEIVDAFCPNCAGDRKCDLLCHTEKDWDDNYAAMWGWDRHEMIRCRGCSTVFFRHLSRFSEDYNGEGDAQLRVQQYPETKRGQFSSRFGMLFQFSAHSKMYGLIQEIYSALNGNLPWLAAMGIRSLVELLAEELSGHTFERTVDCVNGMLEEGWISNKQRETIDAAVELGHSAIHRGHIPKISQVKAALDILESIIELATVNREKAADLKKHVPPRVKPPKTPKA